MYKNKIKIGGIMQSDGRALIKVLSVPDNADVAAAVLGSLAENSINIELLSESSDLDDCANFSIVIDQKDLDSAVAILEDISGSIDAKAVSYKPDVAVITIFGPHLREKPRVHGLMFSAIASVGINSLAISTSISSVSCVIEGQYLNNALEILSDTFDIPFQIKTRPKDY